MDREQPKESDHFKDGSNLLRKTGETQLAALGL
jgi:hypothetical protein